MAQAPCNAMVPGVVAHEFADEVANEFLGFAWLVRVAFALPSKLSVSQAVSSCTFFRLADSLPHPTGESERVAVCSDLLWDLLLQLGAYQSMGPNGV